MKKLILLFLLIPMIGKTQSNQKLDNESGYFQLGLRSTVSAFSDAGAKGYGYGGQFRIRVTNRINTDWYADYLTTDIEGLARRVDGHIGWSVLAYPFNCETTKGKFTPYILAGHCFDYTKVAMNGSNVYKDRYSSAVQAGLGTHYNITDRMDVSLTSQYMMHIGKDVHAHIEDSDGAKTVEIEKRNVSGIEGHLLINVSMNIRLFDMWGQPKKRRA